MNIGIDMRMLGNRHGGIGRYVFELAKHLLKIDPNNAYHIFYNSFNSEERDIEFLGSHANVHLIAANSRHYSISEQTKYLWQLNRTRLDLMHFPNFNVPIWYKKPFVTTIHDMVHHKISGAKKSRLLHFHAYKKVIEHAANASKKIITVSEYSKKDIAGFLHVPDNKIEVVYEGYSLKPEVDEATITRVKKNFLIKRPYFLFVGVLERKKNIINLTRGFDAFLSKYQLDMDLVIAGKTDKHYPDIKHKALDLKHRDRVVFTGYVEDWELAALYRGAFAFVSASLHEGFGLPGVEAMQFGLPLLVSNIEVFNEVYDTAAMYFDPLSIDDIAEKMFILAHDTQFHMQQSEKSIARAALFDWEKTARQTLEVYNNAIS
jgi:glycosyltransferase involved in cell wall biosynthesis